MRDVYTSHATGVLLRAWVGVLTNHVCGEIVVGGSTVSPSGVGVSDLRVASVVWGCVPVSAKASTRSGALWSAPPSFVVLSVSIDIGTVKYGTCTVHLNRGLSRTYRIMDNDKYIWDKLPDIV